MRVLKSAKLGVILVFVFVLFCLPTKKISAQIYSYSYNPRYRSSCRPNYGYRSYSAHQTAYNYVRQNYPFHKHWEQRREQIKQHCSKTNLLYQIKSSNPVVRREAANLLKRFSQDSEVKKALEEILDDPIPRVRGNAIKALLGSEDSCPLQQTVKGLTDFPPSDSQQTVLILARVLCSARDTVAREEAARSLGRFKNPIALGALKIAKGRESDRRVQEEIKNSIIRINAPQGEKKDKALGGNRNKKISSPADIILEREPDISYEEFKKKLGWD